MPSRSPRDIWETALGSLQVQVSPAAYETWLRDTIGLSFEGSDFVIGVSNAFIGEWLERRMRSLLERTLANLLKQPVRITVRVTSTPEPAADDPREAVFTTASPAAPPPQPQGYSPSLSLGQRPDPRLTFDSFIIGSTSKLAHAAANAVAVNPGESYNPLFVYGSPGLGKTHLLHAVAHEAYAHQKSILLATTEDFVNDFVGAARERKIDEFRSRYRSPDVLILDDLQFICGKDKSEENLFHTCNALFRAGKQLVLAADRPPEDLPFTHPRLSSRLQAGLLVDIRPPDYSARLAIVAFKATRMPISIPEEILHYLAARPYPSIRQMEGDLTKVVALSTLLGQSLTLDLATEALAPDLAVSAPQRTLSPAALLQATAAYYHLSMEALTSKSRVRSIVFARQIAMHLIRAHTPTSLEQIGRLIGGRDHTTVLHGVQKITNTSSTDASISEAESAILNIASSPLHRD